MRLTPWLALASLIVAAPGCDPKAEDTYHGEAIASIRGTVTGEPGVVDDPEQLQVIVSWFWYESTDDPSGVGEGHVVEVTAEFPFGFRLDVFVPPSKVNNVGGTRMNLADMYILDGDYPDPDVGGAVPFYAMADRHMVAYLENDAPAGSMAAEFLGGPLPAGFHVLESHQRADCSTSISEWDCEVFGQDDLLPAPDDLDTVIPLLKVDIADGLGGVLPYPWLTLEEVRARWE